MLPRAYGANGADGSGWIGNDSALRVLRSWTDAERHGGLDIDPGICSLVPLLWLVFVELPSTLEVDLEVGGEVV